MKNITLRRCVALGLSAVFLVTAIPKNATASELSENEAAVEVSIGSPDNSALEDIAFDTILEDKNLYTSQLDAVEKKIYKAGLKSINKGKKKFTVKGIINGDKIASACTALFLTYPEKFEFMPIGARVVSLSCTYKSKKTNVILNVSKHYTKQLEKQAKTKVKEIAAEAEAYAASEYPNDQTYGTVKYFNDWLNDKTSVPAGADATDTEGQSTELFYLANCSYGALLYGYRTNNAFALTMSRLLNDAGIKNMLVSTLWRTGTPVLINYVMLSDGKWYYIDGKSFLAGQNTYRTSYLGSSSYFEGGRVFTMPGLAEADYSVQ
ncbi:MAG TPA: hypothetical protein DCL38_07940 [Lachnospiraceae bacterium]|nr:hypothetical protein [Lachnospiraceae bacterium]